MQPAGNKSDGEDEGEAESSSSSSSSSTQFSTVTTTSTYTTSGLDSMANEFRSVLDEFRDNWHRELKSDVKYKNTTLHYSLSLDNTASPEQQAETLFKRAVELEQRGKVYDALQFYRRAVQLDPDIEFKAYEASKIPQQVDNETNNNIFDSNTVNRSIGGSEDLSEEDLYTRFQNDIAKHGQLIMSSRDAGVITTELHIADLPTEILLYILRWVVSAQLDMKSLEQCAAVCKGFYLCARDEEIWKQACAKVWGANLGCLAGTSFNTWRQMYIERERVLFNGCYISKTTYIRLGENSFQDQFYRPVQMVEYYRYIRFLPDGTVFMMTSADEPMQGVSRLKNINQLRPEVLRGHYRLHGEVITLMLKKNQRMSKSEHFYGGKRRGSLADYESNFTTYYIVFNIASTSKKKFSQLIWKNYSIVQMRNKGEVSSDFELTASKYPPLRFSCVRSYHLVSDTPLE